MQVRLPLKGVKGGQAAYIRIHYFGSETRKAVQQALLLGEIDGVDGYVIDCRNNPGRWLEGVLATGFCTARSSRAWCLSVACSSQI